MSSLHFLDLPRPDLAVGLLQGETDTTTLAAHDFDVDVRTGFMPPDPPVSRLPTLWEPWEILLDCALASGFPLGNAESHNAGQSIASDQWREKIRTLPLLETQGLLSSEVNLRRAHLVLAFLIHLYIHSQSPVSVHCTAVVPKSISIPLLRVSNALQLPPLLTYSDTVLYNWKLIDPSQPVSESNIQIATLFTGTSDEAHFFLTSALIELRGVHALTLMRASMNEAFVGDATAVHRITSYLTHLSEVITQLTTILNSVKDACDPRIFYHVVRPWLRGADSSPVPMNTWLFEGAEEYGFPQPNELSGPSAGQSSLIYALDTFLSVDQRSHQASPADNGKSFLDRMKSYMPRHHRAFLEHISREPQKIRDLVLSSGDIKMKDAFNLAIGKLKVFRDVHIQIVALFIVTQAERTQEGIRSNIETTKGTGGTNVMPFLKDIRDRTAHSSLENP